MSSSPATRSAAYNMKKTLFQSSVCALIHPVSIGPTAAPGLAFVITSTAVGRNDPGCFPAEEAKVCAGFNDKFLGGKDATGATMYGYALMPAPVVKFVSLPTSAAPNGGAQPIHHTLVRVDGDGFRWEVPPLSTITLRRIDPPGTWGAFEAEKVMRTLYTVEVSWSASAANGADSDSDDDEGAAASVKPLAIS